MLVSFCEVVLVPDAVSEGSFLSVDTVSDVSDFYQA